jgi:hypothetical protein
VIVQVFVAQRQAKNPLAHQRLDRMLDVSPIAPVDETIGSWSNFNQFLIDFRHKLADVNHKG